ncbi:death-associated inhibitor of apoptosis 1 [Biomphalaria glabrata]|nr:death-associated inhibitor of apoptosis 1 [Biomphalaria glabrata]
MALKHFNLTNPVFQIFLGHCALVLLKTSLMSIVTVLVFYASTPQKKVLKIKSDKDHEEKSQTITEYSQVERVRRCHRNDLENVLPFVLLGLMYVATNPDLTTAAFIFRTFTISRFIHTIVYLLTLPQPLRAIAFVVGFLINIYMTWYIITAALF